VQLSAVGRSSLWALGATTLWSTTDDGRHWRADPSVGALDVRTVGFASPRDGIVSVAAPYLPGPGGAAAEQSCDEPGLFAITGTGALFGIDVANAHASFATNGNISLGADVSLGDKVLGLSSDVEGDIQARSPFDFYAKGDADVYVGGIAFGPTVVASTIGIGGCLSPLGYVEYKWHGSLSGGLLGCDLSDLKPAAFSTDLSRPHAAAPITVARHESSEESSSPAPVALPRSRSPDPRGRSSRPR
jgi:hypothetical protein